MFLLVDLLSSYCNFPESRKKIYFFSICQFVLLQKKYFLWFCLCIFESDTVKSDCPVQIFRKIMKTLNI